jgi:hypothetical protein
MKEQSSEAGGCELDTHACQIGQAAYIFLTTFTDRTYLA